MQSDGNVIAKHCSPKRFTSLAKGLFYGRIKREVNQGPMGL